MFIMHICYNKGLDTTKDAATTLTAGKESSTYLTQTATDRTTDRGMRSTEGASQNPRITTIPTVQTMATEVTPSGVFCNNH